MEPDDKTPENLPVELWITIVALMCAVLFGLSLLARNHGYPHPFTYVGAIWPSAAILVSYFHYRNTGNRRKALLICLGLFALMAIFNYFGLFVLLTLFPSMF